MNYLVFLFKKLSHCYFFRSFEITIRYNLYSITHYVYTWCDYCNWKCLFSFFTRMCEYFYSLKILDPAKLTNLEYRSNDLLLGCIREFYSLSVHVLKYWPLNLIYIVIKHIFTTQVIFFCYCQGLFFFGCLLTSQVLEYINSA